MHFPKLSQLQSRLAASLTASLLVIAIYFIVSSPQTAYAADSIPPEDHNHLFLHGLNSPQDHGLDSSLQDQLDSTGYEPDFPAFDRGIIGRAPGDAPEALVNNVAKSFNIKPGEIDRWILPKDTISRPNAPSSPGLPSLSGNHWSVNFAGSDNEIADVESRERGELRKRQGGSRSPRTVFISLNTCKQPVSSDPDKVPPQLKIYASKVPSNERPGPDAPTDQQEFKSAEGGFASLTLDASDDTYIAIEAPSSEGFRDGYNYDIAVSIDAPFHSYDPSHSNLILVDSDTNATLLITANLTDTTNQDDDVYKQWRDHSPPFMLFAYPKDDLFATSLQNSYCGMKNYAAFASYPDGKNFEAINTSMTNTYLPPSVKQQFYIEKLNGSTAYAVSLAMFGNSTAEGDNVVGGGGKMWKAINFTTKSDSNCRVIYDLPFCSSVAYAVPANPEISLSSLKTLYDNDTARFYKNFRNALAQIPCDAASDAQYSLVQTCADCREAYKSWLCAVSIPRCADFSSSDPDLAPRNIRAPFLNGSTLDPSLADDHAGADALLSVYANSSRNPLIDNEIKPGPYKEVLPCREHCWSMVRACPAKLQFGCPTGVELERSYGTGQDGKICNALDGIALSEGSRRVSLEGVGRWRLMFVGIMMILVGSWM
ncbi:MAG: stretch-activated cation channel mid1 [Sclerophora amabilis]|nr:MAG: stretch-activated cation channel mid1 [Sclerophora amabilis]